MKEINLDQGLQKLKINGLEFEVDVTDVACIEMLKNFNTKYNGNLDVTISKELIIDCKVLIDTVLGNGSYDKLFDKETLKCYLLCFELINVYQLGLTDIYTVALQKTAEEVTKASKEAIDELDKLNTAIEATNKASEVSRKYAIPAKKPAKRNKGKN